MDESEADTGIHGSVCPSEALRSLVRSRALLRLLQQKKDSKTGVSTTDIAMIERMNRMKMNGKQLKEMYEDLGKRYKRVRAENKELLRDKEELVQSRKEIKNLEGIRKELDALVQQRTSELREVRDALRRSEDQLKDCRISNAVLEELKVLLEDCGAALGTDVHDNPTGAVRALLQQWLTQIALLSSQVS